MPRGRPPKPTKLHLMHGTFRRDRHGQRIDAPRPAPGDPWKNELRLSGIGRPLDPIEELLQRERIEITDADKKPKG